MTPTYNSQRGLSLIELMIALLLGLLVTLVAVFVVISQGRTREQNDAISEAQETARLAVELLSSELAQAGYFGDFGSLRWRAELARYRGTASATTPPAIIGDCVPTGVANGGSFPDPAALALGLPFRTLWTARVTGSSPISCVASVTVGSDLLQLKRLVADETAFGGEALDRFYAITDLSGLIFYPGTDAPPLTTMPNGRRFPYTARVYYVADEVVNGVAEPSLFQRELRLSGGTGTMADSGSGALLNGVERVRYLIGVDGNGDGLPDRFVNSQNMTALMWNDINNQVVAVRVIVVARALQVDPQFTEAVTFDLGDGTTFAPGADGRRRVLLSSTIAIRSQL